VKYPQDGGVSAIRFYLSDPDDPLAHAAASALTVAHHDAGRLICQCRFDGFWSPIATTTWALLCCRCNGSSLPLYIGPPPGVELSRALGLDGASGIRCSCGNSHYSAAVAIGYPILTPPLGSLDAERAQEIALALHCTSCGNEYIGWTLRLPAPYPVNAGDPWLRSIQGRFG